MHLVGQGNKIEIPEEGPRKWKRFSRLLLCLLLVPSNTKHHFVHLIDSTGDIVLIYLLLSEFDSKCCKSFFLLFNSFLKQMTSTCTGIRYGILLKFPPAKTDDVRMYWKSLWHLAQNFLQPKNSTERFCRRLSGNC